LTKRLAETFDKEASLSVCVTTDGDQPNREFSFLDDLVTTTQVRENVDYLCLTTATILEHISRATCQSYFTLI